MRFTDRRDREETTKTLFRETLAAAILSPWARDITSHDPNAPSLEMGWEARNASV